MPIDTHCLYQEQIVCGRCYRLYMEMQALLAFQAKFLAKLNLNTEGNPKDLLMRLTSKEELQAQAKDKEILNLKTSIPKGIFYIIRRNIIGTQLEHNNQGQQTSAQRRDHPLDVQIQISAVFARVGRVGGGGTQHQLPSLVHYFQQQVQNQVGFEAQYAVDFYQEVEGLLFLFSHLDLALESAGVCAEVREFEY